MTLTSLTVDQLTNGLTNATRLNFTMDMLAFKLELSYRAGQQRPVVNIQRPTEPSGLVAWRAAQE